MGSSSSAISVYKNTASPSCPGEYSAVSDEISADVATYDQLWDTLCALLRKPEYNFVKSVEVKSDSGSSWESVQVWDGEKLKETAGDGDGSDKTVTLQYVADKMAGTITCVHDGLPNPEKIFVQFQKEPLVVEQWHVFEAGDKQGVRRAGPYVQGSLQRSLNAVVAKLHPEEN